MFQKNTTKKKLKDITRTKFQYLAAICHRTWQQFVKNLALKPTSCTFISQISSSIRTPDGIITNPTVLASEIQNHRSRSINATKK